MSLFFVLAKGSRSYSLAGGNESYAALNPDEANVVWTISGAASGSGRAVGYIQFDGYDTGDAIAFGGDVAFTTPPTGWGTLYVRLTAITNVADATTHAIDGTTWHTLTEGATNISWTETSSGVSETCTVRVEIATDSGGANIVATGDYVSTVESLP